jgi:L-seryl-tRNA(Ser) seleniumtransferase
VHPGNFRVEGFTSAVGVADLHALAGRHGVPLVVDIGSGLLEPDALLPEEPDATTVLASGAALVTCSGDKLLGGPQAGIVLGDEETVTRLRRHPLARALRVDKTTLAALEATLRGGPTLTHDYLHADPTVLRARAESLAASLPPHLAAHVVPSAGMVGGGGAPGLTLPGWAVALPEAYAAALRRADPAVIARVESGRCLVDLRCVPNESDGEVAAAIRSVQGIG